MPSKSKHIAVIGAGIVGLSCALWLQKKGFQVTLLDGNQPGSGTSSGNACTIADYACVPVNDPGIISHLPYYLLNRESPLTLNPFYAATHLPWMFSFLKHCRKKQVYETIGDLGKLLLGVNAGLDPLIEWSKSSDLFRKNGCMYLYATQQGFDGAWQKNLARADQGVSYQVLDSSQISELEPGLKMTFYKGLLYENSRQVLNPQTLCTRYFDCMMQQQGCRLLVLRVIVAA